MKDKAIDEFESMFRKSMTPSIEFEDVDLSHVLVVASFSGVNLHALKIGMEVSRRFSSSIKILFPLLEAHEDLVDEEDKAKEILDDLVKVLNDAEIAHSHAIRRGDPQEVLSAEISEKPPGLVIVPSPIVPHTSLKTMKVLSSASEYLLVETHLPTLIVKNDRIPPAGVFAKALTLLPGNVDEISRFSMAFKLVEDSGSLKLLNVLDQDFFTDEHESLASASEMDTEKATEAILKAKREKVERTLERVRQAMKARGINIDADFVVADPVDKTKEILVEGYHSMLVVRPEGKRRSRASLAFSLVHAVNEVPVLTL